MGGQSFGKRCLSTFPGIVVTLLLQAFQLARRQHHKVHTEHQFTLGAFGRVLQLQRPAGGIPRIGKRSLSLGHPLPIHGLKGFKRIHHLAPCFKVVGVFAPQSQRNGWNGACICRNIVAHGAIAAGHCLHQLSVPIGEPDGNAVVFQFTSIAERYPVEQFSCPGLEILYFLYAVGIAQREHGKPVCDLSEGLIHFSTHALGGGSGKCQLRILVFQIHQLAEKGVELEVAHQRRVVHIVLIVVVVNKLC